MELNEIKDTIINSYSISDCCDKIYGYTNSRTTKKLRKIIEDENIDVSHLGPGKKNIKYEVIDKECPVCGDKFKTQKSHKSEKITCSTGCYNKYRGPRSEDVKNKIATTLIKGNKNRKYKDRKNGKVLYPIGNKKSICIVCDKEYTVGRVKSGLYSNSKTCSKECRFNLKSNNSKELQLKLIKEGRHKGWVSRNIMSYPERFFKKVLESNGLEGKFSINHPVAKRDLGLDCNSSYFLDFYFDDIKLDLEIDGKQHLMEDRVKSDKLRDKSLTDNDYDVYRIKWVSINTKNGKEYIRNEIKKLLEYIKNKRQYKE